MTHFILPAIIKAKEERRMELRRRGRHRKDCDCDRCVEKRKAQEGLPSSCSETSLMKN